MGPGAQQGRGGAAVRPRGEPAAAKEAVGEGPGLRARRAFLQRVRQRLECGGARGQARRERREQASLQALGQDGGRPRPPRQPEGLRQQDLGGAGAQRRRPLRQHFHHGLALLGP